MSMSGQTNEVTKLVLMHGSILRLLMFINALSSSASYCLLSGLEKFLLSYPNKYQNMYFGATKLPFIN